MHKTYQHLNLNDADMTLNSILALIVEGIWDWNANTGQVTRSPGWYHMLGYDVGELREDVFTWENIIHPDDYSAVMAHFEQYISGKTDKYECEYRCKKSDGSYIWIVDRGKIIAHNSDGSVARMIGAHQNIQQQKIVQQVMVQQNKLLKEGNDTLEKIIKKKADELQQKNAQLEQKIAEIEAISNTDLLTKVANRSLFETELSKEIARAKRYKQALSVAVLDIDYFKKINDSFGHKVGDELLCRVSQLLNDNVRELDLIARWGGDEFVIIYPELSSHSAFQACEKLRQLIANMAFKTDIPITCSFGVTQYQDNDNVASLFHRADTLLFSAKQQGRNKVVSET
ncbi:sensor domain-containing diguanylate cyclase [Thalassotalea sp. PLHSN55]|uniref:sensor domain-containing diguanylate cyclase n=1 Tax=Thalassotalea sp. PLHSN55 TaxID=3435888 RepID=UPI003F860ABB